jgi:S-adenosylmethionine-diacylglycerol 3-amino-3-carboxypropyl transferase
MSGEASLPQWVQDAARMPVAFAQVREDALLDLAVLDQISADPIDCMMIASGGCTAAALTASERIGKLLLVDVNPAQMALTQLKLHLLQNAEPGERLRLLGHAPMADRAAALAAILAAMGLERDALGPLADVAAVGPDHAGRYELVFARLRKELEGVSDELLEVLNLDSAAQRKTRVEPHTPLGRAMDRAFNRTMALPNLISLFSAAATQNSVQPFARHFAGRTRHAIATLPTRNNPYLWQLLVRRFPGDAVYPWLDAPKPARMPEITSSVCTFDAELAKHRHRFDLVHLSNILDWLSPEAARRTLELAFRALRPGGCVFIRQLNSTLAIPSLNQSLSWRTSTADALHARDRSFFYAHLHLGQKP